MNLITRRGFIGGTMRAALLAAAGAFVNIPLFLREALAAGEIQTTPKKLLFIFLRGGNDGLNTLIPWADDAYNLANRPSLYLPRPDLLSTSPGQMPEGADPTKVLDLGNGFAGLHPSLSDLRTLYNAGQVAAIHRVGYSKQSRSHFDSQRYWENGVPRNNLIGTGIFYRALTELGLHQNRSFPAVSVQNSNPLLLRGPTAFTNLSDPARYDLMGVTARGTDKNKQLAMLTAAHQILYPERQNRDALFATGKGLEDSIEGLKSIGLTSNNYFDTDGVTHLFPVDAASNQKGFRSSSYDFFSDLKAAAQILAGTDAVIVGTQLSGFDTHNNQGALAGGHSDRLRWLGWGMYAVKRFLEQTNPALWQDTLIVTLSEFGRTSKENGSGGTDHAEASVMFLAGGNIRGGVYQCSSDSWPIGPSGAMFQVNSRYLRRTVDYRSVLGEIIRKHLGATTEQLSRIIPGYADARERLLSGGVAPDGTTIKGELNLLG